MATSAGLAAATATAARMGLVPLRGRAPGALVPVMVRLLASAHGRAYIVTTGLMQTPPNSMPCRTIRLEARCGGVHAFGTGNLVDTSAANLNKAARVR